MQKNFVKMSTCLTLFILMIMAMPASVTGIANHSNEIQTSNKVNNSTPDQFNVSPHADLIYNVSSLLYNGTNTLNINDSYNYPAGSLVQGHNIAFSFEGEGSNGTMNYVNGTIKGPEIYNDLQISYFFLDPANVTTARMGPPLLYFVIPSNVNYTEIYTNFTNAGFTVLNTSTTFGVSINYYSASSVFSKVGDSTLLFNSFLNVTWDKATGIMQTYLYNFSGTPAAAIGFTYLGSFDPNVLNPTFAYSQAGLFYNIAKMSFNGTNQEPLNNQNNSAYGYFAQGQNAFASIQTQMSTNGPVLNGQINTLTGSMPIDNPFNGTGNGPTVFFLFPIASNANWWNEFALELSVVGINQVSQSNGIITFRQYQPGYKNNNVTMSFNMTTGVETHFLLMMDNATGMAQNVHGPFIVELNFIKAYNIDTLKPAFNVKTNTQYQYHIDTLNFVGNNTAPMDYGYIKQGQDMNVQFDKFVTGQGMYALATLQTITGKGQINITYDIFGQNQDAGPIFFFLALPVNPNTPVLNFFGDIFSYIAGATITNNATVFGISVTGLNGHDLNINQLTIQWNKTNGLMLYYKVDLQNPNNMTERIQLTVHYIGQGSGNLYQPSGSTSVTTSSTNSGNTQTISSPGFELPIFMLAIVPVLIFSRKRRNL